MGEKKVTRMLIKVDLQCGKCYRKIKKVLCSFPQIRDQIYDEKKNTVIITVVCCSPEKIKAKICCKGGDTILGIEIIPDKPKEPEQKKEPEKSEKKEPEKKNEVPEEKPAPPKVYEPVPLVPWVPAVGYPPVYVVGTCCCPPCYGGYGPCCRRYRRPPQMCHDGCGRPAHECQGGNHGYSRPLQMCDDGCGRPANECQGRNHGYSRPPQMCHDGCGRLAYECQGRICVSRCSDYFSEANASECTVM